MGAYERPTDGGCLGDVTEDNVVGVPDLLAVINAWGACGPPCAADVSPTPVCGMGDGTVGVPDLLLVINRWAACTSAPVTVPTSISDCWDVFCNGLTGAEWQDCVNKCTESVCQEFPEECD